MNADQLTSDREVTTRCGRTIPAGTAVEFIAPVMSDTIRVRLADGAEVVVDREAFPEMRYERTPRRSGSARVTSRAVGGVAVKAYRVGFGGGFFAEAVDADGKRLAFTGAFYGRGAKGRAVAAAAERAKAGE